MAAALPRRVYLALGLVVDACARPWEQPTARPPSSLFAHTIQKPAKQQQWLDRTVCTAEICDSDMAGLPPVKTCT